MCFDRGNIPFFVRMPRHPSVHIGLSLRSSDHCEVTRARNLVRELVQDGSVQRVAFNSAAAEREHRVKRIAQKHAVEGVLGEAPLEAAHFLRANLFMEELWKGYTGL